MKPFRWDLEKNETLKVERRVSFEGVVVAIASGSLIDVVPHPDPAKYPRQKVLVVALENHVPSRKATRDYWNKGEADAKN